MKIIIFGSNGMLGNYVKTFLTQKKYEIIALTRKDFDLCNINIIELDIFMKKINLMENDIIINCCGIIPQSSAYRNVNKQMYYKINSIFPIILSSICDKYNVKMIHITTDCVFSGKNGNYNENSVHDEINDYGVSKSLGELCKATIIRTSIIGEEIYNKCSLLEWVKSNYNGKINGFNNHYWNGVTCLELSKIIDNIIINNNFWVGVRHIHSPNKVSKYELVKMINDVYNLNIKINELETEIIDKSLCTIYDLNKFNVLELHEQIKELKYFNINTFFEQ